MLERRRLELPWYSVAMCWSPRQDELPVAQTSVDIPGPRQVEQFPTKERAGQLTRTIGDSEPAFFTGHSCRVAGKLGVPAHNQMSS